MYTDIKHDTVESVIGRDILQNRKVANPALFRQALEIFCRLNWHKGRKRQLTRRVGMLDLSGES